MKDLAEFYRGTKGQSRIRALQGQLDQRILSKIKSTDKVSIWTSIPGLLQTGDIDQCPFSDNQRPPFGNGALDHLVIIHCFDLTQEPEGLMAEAVRIVRDHGLIDVIGRIKPRYDHALPVWERERHHMALRFMDPWSLRWRRYEKVQDLLTLTFDAQKVTETVPVPAAAISPRNVS